VLQIGADADIVLVDLAKRGKFEGARMETKGRETAKLFEGLPYVGAPVMTLVRGRIVMQDGKVVGEAGDGMFIPVKTL